MRFIALSDITLKTSDGQALSFKEKIELAKLLDRLNVSVIELSPIHNRKIDSLLVKSVAMSVKNAAVAVPVCQSVESVEIAWAAVKEARKPRLQVQAPMSPTQMEYFWHKKPDKMLEAVTALVSSCREKCADVEFIADDACRSEREFLYQAVDAAIRAGASAVTLCDAAGLMFPEELSAFIEDVKAHVPALEGVRLGMQCGNALSMAAACAMGAVRAGAEEIKTVSCASDVTALADIAAILKNRGDSFQLTCGVRHAEMHRITGQIERLCRSRSAHSPYDGGTSAVAEAAGMVLSVHDDLSAVCKAVEKLGYALSDEDNAKVYAAFQTVAAKKEQVSARELDAIVASVALQVPPTYQLVNYVINCGNAISASAHIKLQKEGGVLEGICLGDGPIDAAFLSIEQVIGHHYELDDFQIQSVTEGREALGETVVRLRSGGKLYSGRGSSTDIVGASILAYLSALNKIVYEEAEA